MTETVSHTPGPWQVKSDDISVVGRRNVGAFDVVAHVAPRQNTHANARLIAAAPDLLAALKSLMEYMSPDDYAWASRVQDAYTAIAKAEGRA